MPVDTFKYTSNYITELTGKQGLYTWLMTSSGILQGLCWPQNLTNPQVVRSSQVTFLP